MMVLLRTIFVFLLTSLERKKFLNPLSRQSQSVVGLIGLNLSLVMTSKTCECQM